MEHPGMLILFIRNGDCCFPHPADRKVVVRAGQPTEFAMADLERVLRALIGRKKRVAVFDYEPVRLRIAAAVRLAV